MRLNNKVTNKKDKKFAFAVIFFYCQLFYMFIIIKYV